jgi:phosphate transport system protein
VLHLRRQLDRLRDDLLPLGLRVEAAIDRATRAVVERDAEAARALRDEDLRVHEAGATLEEACLSTLALPQPVAFDLRFVVSVLKIKDDLTRMTELARGLASHAIALAALDPVDAPYDLGTMGVTTRKMVHMALDALASQDTSKAQMVRELDDIVDDVHRGMYEQVVSKIEAHPEHITSYIHLQNVSRQLERLADLATNIAKDVIYLAEGEIVRHRRAMLEAEPSDRADTPHTNLE